MKDITKQFNNMIRKGLTERSLIALLSCGISIKSICASFLLGKVRIESLFPLKGELIRDSGTSTRGGTAPDQILVRGISKKKRQHQILVRDISKEEETAPDCVVRDTHKKKAALNRLFKRQNKRINSFILWAREKGGEFTVQ